MALLAVKRTALLAPLLTVGLCACGNKGDLFIAPDEETLQQIEQAQQDIEQSARKKRKRPLENGQPGTEQPAQ